MNYKPIIVLAGEPNSIFTEIFFKALKSQKFKSPIILIGSHKLIKLQMNKLNMTKKIKLINLMNIKKDNLNNKNIYLININYNQKKHLKKFRLNQISISKNPLKSLLKF